MIGRDAHGGLYFERPDGRVIPRGGYRAEDLRDDGAGDGHRDAAVTRLLDGLVGAARPSAEVRRTPTD
jgi:hypothetical protein